MRCLSLWVCLLLSSCTSYEERPLHPELLEAEFRSRTLSDPELRRYLESLYGHPLSPFPPPSWDLEALALVAFYYHPDLDVARARVAQVRAGGTTAGALPNPTLGVLAGRSLLREPGTSPWLSGFDLSMPLDLLWKRGYRVEQAAHLTEAAILELGEVAWHVRSRLRRALADHLLAEREFEVRRAEEAVRAEASRLMTRRLAVGEAFRLDVHTAQAGHFTSLQALRAAKTRVEETRATLAAAVGVPAGALESRALVWPDFEKPPALESLSLPAVQTAGLLNRLDVRRLLAEYAAAEAALGLEMAKRYPDVSLGPGYEFEQGERRFVLGLSITLPVFDQNAGPIAEALARRKEVGARFLGVQARAIAEMERALIRFQGAREELAEVEKTLGTLQERERAVARAVELGESDRTALAGMRIETLAASNARLAALAKTQAALGDLEGAVQRPLGQGKALPEILPESPRTGQKQ